MMEMDGMMFKMNLSLTPHNGKTQMVMVLAITNLVTSQMHASLSQGIQPRIDLVVSTQMVMDIQTQFKHLGHLMTGQMPSFLSHHNGRILMWTATVIIRKVPNLTLVQA
jgi:hypothetical protein